MQDPNKEVKTNKVDETTDQPASAEETNTQNPTDDANQGEHTEEENVSISKKELEDLKKKASDFDGIIEKKRLEKISKREEKQNNPEKTETPDDSTATEQVSADDIQRMVQENVNKAMSQVVGQQQSGALQKAYREFLQRNPWADNDDAIEKISSQFSAGTSTDEKELLSRLELAAQSVDPVSYQSSLENRVRSEMLANDQTIAAGEGGGSGTSVPKQPQPSQPISADDRRMADKFFGGDIQRWMKHKNSQ